MTASSTARGTAYYLGPETGLWAPSTWAEVVAAAAAGVLDETHWVELKEAVPPASKPANLELARDLASLAVDSGLLVVGVRDDGGNAGEVVGTDLTGLAQRVDQVARDRAHPPLTVAPRELTDPERPGHGVLLVAVPASPAAPHMVDERYWSRGATGKRVLPDSEVRRLLEQRRADPAAFVASLHQLADDDPLPVEEGGNGHLYVLAAPRTARPDALLDRLSAGDREVSEWLWGRLVDARARRQGTTSASLLTSDPRHPIRIARGAGLSTLDRNYPREADENRLVEIVIAEDGAVALTCGSGVRVLNAYGDGRPDERALHPGLVLDLVHDVVALAGELAETYAGYVGQWQLGVLLRGARDARAVSPDRSSWIGHAYNRDEYLRTTEAVTAELTAYPAAVVERLVAPLLRSLGAHRQYLPYPPAAQGRP